MLFKTINSFGVLIRIFQSGVISSETIVAGLGELGCTWLSFSPETPAFPAPVWLQLWLCQGAFSWNFGRAELFQVPYLTFIMSLQ